MKVMKTKCGTEFKVCNCDYELIKHMKITLSCNGYLRIRSYKNRTDRSILLHQLIIGKKYGMVIDHINQDTLDNRRCNLRHASRSLNAVNSSKKRKQNSGYIGVFHNKRSGTFYASVRKDNRKIYVGAFKTAFDAAIARDDIFFKLHGKQPNLNFPGRFP